jgi:tetratricopeptide (TPR) repeat protein
MNENVIREIAAAVQRGTPDEGERLSRLWLERTPDDENLSFLLALCLQYQARHAEALVHYEKLARRFPESALHLGNYATALRQVGRIDEAAQAARAAIELVPDDASNYINLGLTQIKQDRYDEAQETLLKAYSLDPDSPLTRIHAAGVLAAVRDAQTYTLLRPWRSWLPLDDTELQLQLAHLLTLIGEANAAHEVLVDLLKRLPGHLQARLRLASIEERRNELDIAEAMLTDIAARHPGMDEGSRQEILHQRAMLAMRRGKLDEARAMLEQAGPRGEFDPTHFFTLAEVLNKLGDKKNAMRVLATAHERQIAELRPMTPGRFAEEAAILPNTRYRLSAGEFAAWPKLVSPPMKDSPVFIVGFPRSGTTLLEQMLDAHPALQSMDERPFMSILGGELNDHGLQLPQDLNRLGQRDCDELRKRYLGLVCEKIQRKWDARLVDKLPLNMLWLPLINRLFPHAKIILCLRHPCDVVLSNYMQNYRSSVLASACSTLERTAHAYVAAFEAWLHHVEVIKPDAMVSRYEDLVGDLPRQTERIAAFLELDDATPMQRFDRHARDKGFIATPSYTEVIKPVSRKAVNRWLQYREYFEPILPILKPMLDHWGYDTDGNGV